VLMRLNEGPILFVSFTGPVQDDKGILFSTASGGTFRGYGLFAALSYDEGKSWPVRKLLAPAPGEYGTQGHTRSFHADDTHAEPRGYMAATQTPDNTVHLISSGLHYRFNLKWLQQLPPIPRLDRSKGQERPAQE